MIKAKEARAITNSKNSKMSILDRCHNLIRSAANQGEREITVAINDDEVSKYIDETLVGAGFCIVDIPGGLIISW